MCCTCLIIPIEPSVIIALENNHLCLYASNFIYDALEYSGSYKPVKKLFEVITKLALLYQRTSVLNSKQILIGRIPTKVLS